MAAGDLPADAADFAAQSKFGNVNLKGIKNQPKGTPTFLNSILTAWQMGTTKLNVVETDNSANGNAPFGLAADFIKSVVAAKSDGTKFPKLTNLDEPGDVPAAFDFGDFNLVLVEP